MGWLDVTTGWIIEPVILLFTLNLILKTIVTYLRKVDGLTRNLWDVTLRCKALSDHLDYEFDLMKRCTKSVVAASVDYNTFYKAVKENSRAVSHGLCQTQTILPAEVTRRLSSVLVPSRTDGLEDLLRGIESLASEPENVFGIRSLERKESETGSDAAEEEGSVTLFDFSGESSSLDATSVGSVEGIDALQSPFFKERRQIVLIPNLAVIPDEADANE